MSRNPYDRRRDGEDVPWADGMMMVGHGPHPRAIELADLDAMVASAYERGREDATRAADARAQEARRVAWDQGHETGRLEGETVAWERLLARVRDTGLGVRRLARDKVNLGSRGAFVGDRPPEQATKLGLWRAAVEFDAVIGHLLRVARDAEQASSADTARQRLGLR